MIGSAAGVDRELIERESELTQVRELLNQAREGQGRLLSIEGPAGIGKTSLLEAACAGAARAGFLVLRARARRLEREFPHGVVRQLFEAHLARLPADERQAILSGAARLAAPVVAPDAAPAGDAAADVFAVTHSLYWLTANLAEQAPLVVAVDDAQWCDVSSLRFLAHAAHRVEGLQLALAVCIRSDEPGELDASLADLASEPAMLRLSPEPLSDSAVAELLVRELGVRPDPVFAAACRHATGGVPFLLRELISAVGDKRIEPTADAVGEVGVLGPQSVASAVLQRLGRSSEAAVKLARSVAVLGTSAQLRRAAELADLNADSAVEAADALAAMDILAPGHRLDFTHPIVRSAIYDDLPAASRATAHQRAADLLAREGAEPGAVATQLLVTPSAGRAETVATLRKAARDALTRGAPESAIAYLNRALDEGGFDRETQAAVLFELGTTHRSVNLEEAVVQFRRAYDLSADPVRRAETMYALADLAVYVSEAAEDMAHIDQTIAAVAEREPRLTVGLEALRAAFEFVDARRLADLFGRLPKLRELAGPGSPAHRAIAIELANLAAWLGEPSEEVNRLLDLGLEGGYSPAQDAPESWLVVGAVQAAALVENAARAMAIADEAVAIAQARGSRIGVGQGCAMRSWIHGRAGDLVSAESDARTALELVRTDAFGIAVEPGVPFQMIDVLVDRAECEDEARRVAERESDTEPSSLYWALLLEARGRTRLALGDLDGGVEDLTRIEETLYAHNNPNGWGWRPALALAVAGRDPDRAHAVLDVYLQRAKDIGLPRAIGIGLRTLGMLEGGQEGLAHLEEAVTVLEGSPARLEHARALVEVGAAQRRANQRAAAREPLREGLDLARRCGATRLAERAREELAATGARLRREMLTGRDALTATEQRIAAMAAEGLSNPDIAQALFVTRKTVENHLSRIYPKLGINSRTQLAEALATATD